MRIDFDPNLIERLADARAVYRMRDDRGALIYVGVTGRAGRFDEHAIKAWFLLVRTIELEWHDSEASAREAERVAIATEHPLKNIAGKRAPGSPAPAAQPTAALALPLARRTRAPVPPPRALVPARTLRAQIRAILSHAAAALTADEICSELYRLYGSQPARPSVYRVLRDDVALGKLRKTSGDGLSVDDVTRWANVPTC